MVGKNPWFPLMNFAEHQSIEMNILRNHLKIAMFTGKPLKPFGVLKEFSPWFLEKPLL